MSVENIVRVCAPTLAGLKTGSIVTCTHEGRPELNAAICRMNRTLRGKGLLAIPLKWNRNSAIVYVFRPEQLKRDLNGTEAARILEEKGYGQTGVNGMIAELIGRLKNDGEFPHEIGLFLGYPPEDVRGFMENRAGGCKCAGLWKVYGDVGTAEKRFACFKKCSRVYSECYRRGVPLEKLAVKTA